LIISALATGMVFRKKNASAVHRSRVCVFEFATESGGATMVKRAGGSFSDEESTAIIVAATMLGEYFQSCGAPPLYPRSRAAVLDGEIATATEKVYGKSLFDLMNEEIPSDVLREKLEQICLEAAAGKAFLAVGDGPTAGHDMYIPMPPLLLDDGEAYGEENDMLVYVRDGGKFLPIDDFIDTIPPLSRDCVIDSIYHKLNQFLCLGSRWNTYFLFEPYFEGDFAVISASKSPDGTCHLCKIPLFPSAFGGSMLRHAVWMTLLDHIVAYPDRMTPSNTFVLDDGSMRSIDFDDCCDGALDIPPPRLSVVDFEMVAAVEKLSERTISRIAIDAGLDKKAAAAAAARTQALRLKITQLLLEGKVIDTNRWAEQKAECAFGETFLPCAIGTKYGEIFLQHMRFLQHRNTLAPNADERMTDAELYLANVIGIVRPPAHVAS
jgi:hypothetical protein